MLDHYLEWLITVDDARDRLIFFSLVRDAGLDTRLHLADTDNQLVEKLISLCDKRLLELLNLVPHHLCFHLFLDISHGTLDHD